MRTILPTDVDAAIEKIRAAGAKVGRKTHALYVTKTVKLTPDHYPLKVIEVDELPKGAVALIAEKGQYAS